jgi:hypothetical protein
MGKAKVRRHGVTLDATVARMNRHLAAKDHIIRAPRGRRWHGERTYFIVDINHGTVVAEGLTAEKIEKIARANGLLQPWEEVI